MSRVHFIAPWYEYYPILADSLRLQTHKDWTLDLIHDGPCTMTRLGEWRYDDRVEARATHHRHNDWGHTLRDLGLKTIETCPDYIVVTNADNYYMPIFLEQMLQAADGHDGAYCDMITSHHGYKLWPARLECNHIDCGSLMVRAGLAASTPWTSRRFAADWDWIAELLKKTQDFVHVERPLFCHN